MTLHRVETGSGEPAVFVHGSFGRGLDTFAPQQQLGDQVRVVLVDRTGFGATPSADVLGWPTDAPAVVALLEELGGAHLVGQSYGAVVALVLAGRRPDLIRSLVVIEPPLFDITPDEPAVRALVAAMRPVLDRASGMTAAEYVRAWAAAALGRSTTQIEAWTATWGPDDWAAADASRRERWPGDAPVDLPTLAALTVPKVVVAGAWPGQENAGAPFRAVVDRLAERIGAEKVVFDESGHNPQLREPERFNALLRSTWAKANTRPVVAD